MARGACAGPDAGGRLLVAGLDPLEPLTTRQLNRSIHAATEAALIEKRLSMHTPPHSFTTHLLEQLVDIRMIQVLLGAPCISQGPAEFLSVSTTRIPNPLSSHSGLPIA